MERLRFAVESLQGMAAGKMELEGAALQGLTDLLESVYLDLITEQRHTAQRVDDLKERLDVLAQIKSEEIALAFFKGGKP